MASFQRAENREVQKTSKLNFIAAKLVEFAAAVERIRAVSHLGASLVIVLPFDVLRTMK